MVQDNSGESVAIFDTILPLPIPSNLAYQWLKPLRRRIEVILIDLFHRLDANSLTWDEAQQGLCRMKAYHDLTKEIERDARQFDKERASIFGERQ